MKVRHIEKRYLGWATQFNIHALAEVIVGFEEGDMDSMFTKELEVFIEKTQEWKPFQEAEKDHDIICDNYNTYFFEPSNKEDRIRGCTL